MLVLARACACACLLSTVDVSAMLMQRSTGSLSGRASQGCVWPFVCLQLSLGSFPSPSLLSLTLSPPEKCYIDPYGTGFRSLSTWYILLFFFWPAKGEGGGGEPVKLLNYSGLHVRASSSIIRGTGSSTPPRHDDRVFITAASTPSCRHDIRGGGGARIKALLLSHLHNILAK